MLCSARFMVLPTTGTAAVQPMKGTCRVQGHSLLPYKGVTQVRNRQMDHLCWSLSCLAAQMRGCHCDEMCGPQASHQASFLIVKLSYNRAVTTGMLVPHKSLVAACSVTSNTERICPGDTHWLADMLSDAAQPEL